MVSSVLYRRTRLLSPMREEEFDATTWQYGGCPKEELASCVPEHLLDPNSTQLQRLIDKAKEAEAHYGGDAWRAERPKASCRPQVSARFSSLVSVRSKPWDALYLGFEWVLGFRV